jgi:hypothetical protein
MRNSTSADETVLSRRRVLAAGASAGAVALAGCSAIVDFLADFILKDVNIFNGTTRRVRGTITVSGPDGAMLLDKRFSIAAGSEEEPSNTTDGNGSGGDQNTSTRGHSGTDRPVPLQDNETGGSDPGGTETDDNESDSNETDGNGSVSNDPDQSLAAYGDVLTSAGEYTVTLDLDSAVNGQQSVERTVNVENPDNEHIMVFIGSDSEQSEGPFLVTAIKDFSDLEELNESDVQSNN